jgi:hypothetical protein
LEAALVEKLQQQLDTQLRDLKERRSIARSDEDLHEAAKDVHHWWLFTFDWLHTFIEKVPEARSPRLAEAVNRAAQAVRDEFPKDAPDPRNIPDMQDTVREWAVQPHMEVRSHSSA